MISEEILTVGKKDIPVKITELKQADLKFYPENPRVYSVLNGADANPSQEEIQEHMCSLDHVKQLRVSIESNGGLIDPLIVRDGDFMVLEGNSRLAAYRILNEKDPVKWGMVKCKILPADITDDTIFALLGQYHIIGRKDWEPFEQAHYLYRRHKQTKLPVDYMAKELGITKGKAEKMIQVIEFMIEKDDLNKRHWSYYEEYLKNAQLKKYRETSSELDDVIATQVKTGAIQEAADIRKLGDVAKVGDKQSKKIMQKFISEDMSLYDAYEEMSDSGKLEDAIKKLTAFRKAINDPGFEKQMTASEETIKQASFEIKRIMSRLKTIKKIIGDE